MPINKQTTAPNGAPLTHHIVSQLVATTQATRVTINSYLHAPAPGARVNWQDTHDIDPASLAGPDLIGSAETWLISQDGPLAGGTIVGTLSPAGELRAQLIALAAARRRDLRKVYVHDFGGELGEVPFDADEASAGNILAKLTAPLLLGAAGFPLPEEESTTDYKCADDVYRAFTAGAFQAVGFGMLAYVQDLYTRERELIDLVTAAGDDVEALGELVVVVKTFLRPVEPPPETP